MNREVCLLFSKAFLYQTVAYDVAGKVTSYAFARGPRPCKSDLAFKILEKAQHTQLSQYVKSEATETDRDFCPGFSSATLVLPCSILEVFSQQKQDKLV